MPFKSYAQESFLKHKHPEIYKRWLGEHGHYSGTKKHVDDSAKKAESTVKEANMNFQERVVEALQISAVAIQKAEKDLNEKQASEQRYAALVPAVVEKCVKCGRIEDTKQEREKLAEWLSTPEGALAVIDKLAEHVVEAPVAQSMGQQVDAHGRPAQRTTKQASADNDYRGGRRTAEEPESWRRLTSGLGLAL